MGQYCFARWRLSSSSVVCNTVGGRAGGTAAGHAGGRRPTFHGGPVVLHSIRVIPCYLCICAESTPLEAWHICPACFRCGWPVGVELAAGLHERSGSRQGHIQEALQDVFIRTLLMHAAH